MRRCRERWREWWENLQTGHHGWRHGNDSTARTPQNAPTPLSPWHGALAPEATTPFTSERWGHSQPHSRGSTSPNYWTDTCVPSSPRADHGLTCEGLSARYGLWKTWDGSTAWSRLDIGAWRNQPSETRRSKDSTEGLKRYPYLHGPVAQRSNGPGSPWPSSPSHACGVWGRQPGFDGAESRTRPSSLGATRTVTKLSNGSWAHTPQSGRGDYGSTGRRRSPIMCPSGSLWLESFLEYGFRGTEYASHRWHCWKRGGAALQKYLALPAEIR